MAEGFEFQPYHVPQQSRRDKLRVLSGQPDQPPGFYPFPPYDPSSDLLSCDPTVKEEGHVISHHFMGFRNHPFAYLDPDPASVQEISTNPFLYPPPNLQNMRDFDHPAPAGYGGAAHEQVAAEVVYKPEPLALSLSSSQHNQQRTNGLQRYGSGSGVNYGSVNVGSGSSDDVMDGGSRGALGPLGPFTGYASILKGSRFLKPAQQLLEEFCDVGNREIYAARVVMSAGDDSSSFLDPNVESLTGDDDAFSPAGDGGESRRKRSRLVSMLDEVYKRYKQYYQQMQAVVTSFEYVAGLGNAAPYANLAIKATTLHFKCLKNAITEQLQFRNSDHSTRLGQGGKDEAQAQAQMLRNGQGIYSQRSSIHSSEFVEHQPVWRPQRGLPERAVTALRAWLFEHFLHPYPTDSEKLLLAKQTGLSRSQVSNWFINARVRLWKPMVEEIHTLETRQLAQKGSEVADQNANRSSDYDHLPSSTSLASDNPSTSTPRVQDTSSKRTRNDLSEQITIASTQPLNLSYSNMPSQIHLGHVGMSNMAGGSSGGVSLTLGLHQNNGVGNLSEPFPINAAQRFGLGLDGNGEGYAMGGFDAQNRHFGRIHHAMGGGQLLHDFVG